MAHEREEAAFEHFAHVQPDNVVLLIDTYDTEAAARKAVQIAPRLRERGITIKGVRLDSGDLAEHARQVRRILDEGGLKETIIFCSGDLDEHSTKELLAAGAPIDGFGIGTRLDISVDAPALDCVYKLQEYAGNPKRKRSEGKATWPGRKQIYRGALADGTLAGDCLGLEDHPHPGEVLLQPVMTGGRRLAPAESLAVLRERVNQQLAALPPELRTLTAAPPYAVEIAPELRELAAHLDQTNR
jgi:nicotinate phosphoribosyltransferase